MVDAVLTAGSQAELGRIVDFIHDQRFEIERLNYLPSRKTVRISFDKEDRTQLTGRWYQLLYHRWSVPVVEYILEVKCVLAYSMRDPAQIAEYTFNTISYDPSKRQILIQTCEDLQVTFDVEGVAVAIVPTGKKRGSRSVVTVLGCEISGGRLGSERI